MADKFREEDEVLRQGVRQNLAGWLKKLECDGDVNNKLMYKMKFVRKLSQAPVAIETDAANEQHYEVPTEFFTTVLGKRLKYSSTYWPEEVQGLEEAEEVTLQMVCDRAQVQNGHTVMDLGCGWGSLALWVCEKYPQCSVLAVSNSSTQRQFIESQARQRGFTARLQCVTADANVFSTSRRFDRIISIEMFEHMKNYEQLMHRVARWLRPAGLLFVQILCHREFAYEFNSNRGSDTEWMARNFFSGGTMPSDDLLLYFQKDLCIMDHWCLNGNHYAKTLEAWLDRLYLYLDKVRPIFASAYGADLVEQHLFNWRMFFIYCAEVFAFRSGNEWMVSHYLFQKKPASTL